jgi:hypothetical protein
LAEKIKELGKSKGTTKELTTEKSFWQTIKTPLFYGLGVIIVIIAVGWIYSKCEE